MKTYRIVFRNGNAIRLTTTKSLLFYPETESISVYEGRISPGTCLFAAPVKAIQYYYLEQVESQEYTGLLVEEAP